MFSDIIDDVRASNIRAPDIRKHKPCGNPMHATHAKMIHTWVGRKETSMACTARYTTHFETQLGKRSAVYIADICRTVGLIRRLVVRTALKLK